VLSEAGSLASNAWAFPADLTDSAQANQLMEEAIRREGKIDALVNNVGQGIRRELIDTSDEEWDFLVKINLSSAFYACRAVLSHMRKQKAGRIVNIASRAGRVGEGELAAYSALKHGVVGLTRALADSESKFGIQVSAVCPGLVATERMLAALPTVDFSGSNHPDDVAEAVLFLLSPSAATMEGQVIDMFTRCR
jgi:NAD(P)-dependent dehydrogenase (short-subunit alcohol dehydrogenase family)